MFFRQYKPSAVLMPFVESYIIFEDAGTFKDVELTIVPSGVSELAIHFGDSVNSYLNNPNEVRMGYIYGPHNKKGFFKAQGNIKCLCVMFKPWGGYRVFGISQTDIRNYAIELDQLCGNDGKIIIEKVATALNHIERIHLIDDFLIKQLQKTKEVTIKICEAISLIHKNKGNIKIGYLSSKVKIGIKTLERHFKNIIGFTPKEYTNIVRLNSAYKLVKNKSCINIYDIIFQCGYYDQAHFINEIKKYTNLSAQDFLNTTDEHIIFLNRMYSF